MIIPATVTERLMSIAFGKVLGGYVYPEPLVIISGAGLFLGGLALSLGYFTRLAALGLICILIPITITVQTQGMHTLGPLLKNIGLLGGLIYFAANGSCSHSLDSKIQTSKISYIMKKIQFLLIVFVFTALLTPAVHGQSIEKKQSVHSKESQSYAMLIRNMNHLNAAIKTVQMLEEDDQKTIANFEVVICGKEVKDLREHSDLIYSAKEHNIRLSACGMSLKKFSVSESALPADIQVVPNGLIRLFELQQQGYHTIAL